jgi:Family of unknown function (DUF6220)
MAGGSGQDQGRPLMYQIRKEHLVRRVYVGLSGLLLLAVVAQFYFAAVGAFAKPQDDASFALHDLTGGMIIPTLSLLATIAALVARLPGRQVGLTILPLGLVIVQLLIVGVGKALSDSDAGDHTTPVALAVLGLHAVNGLAIMAVAGRVLSGAIAAARSAPVPSTSSPAV